MKKILITGGAGFIGSNLCERLLKENNRIICLDNLLTGNIKNIEHLLDNPNFEFINHDIIEPIVIEGNIDEIYNLACPASPPKYQIDPINTLKVNFIGVSNLLELAKLKNARFLQSSTSEVYGEPKVSPQKEEYRGNVNTIGIRSCYDEGKRIAETLVIEYNKKYGVDTRIARIFNTYGPKMDKNDGRVVSNFINQAINNEDITLYGDGEQTRSFCYIEDQLDGLIKLMNSNYIYPVNIGNPNEITMKQLAELILHLTKSDSKLVYRELPQDDPTNRCPDITKAINIIGWKPVYHLHIGLTNTIHYFQKIAREN
jgi:UDP-glucuronate decarboxylase